MESAGRLIPKMNLPREIDDREARARAAWNRAAGKTIASHTRVLSLVRETLVIEVEDMVWQHQLNTLRHFMIRNLTKVLGEFYIKELDFRPMPRRRGPQISAAARPTTSSERNGIEDPVMSLLYEQSRRNAV
jgi:hypothetical protein